MGRKKLPDEMKVLRGTAQPCRMTATGAGGSFEKLDKIPKSGLKGVAKKIYEDAARQLVACGVLDVVGAPILVSYAQEMGTYFDLMKEMEKAKPEDNDGLIYEEFSTRKIKRTIDVDPDTGRETIFEEETVYGEVRKINPKRKIAQGALANAKALASEFGFTPASRSKIAAMLAGATKPVENDFAEFEEL